MSKNVVTFEQLENLAILGNPALSQFQIFHWLPLDSGDLAFYYSLELVIPVLYWIFIDLSALFVH